ncbi:MAG TPA: tetratricopeptide repeat protein [Kofleriaceae bacterium]
MTKNRSVLIALALAVLAMACGKKEESKEAMCARVAAKIRDEELAKCAGDKECIATADEMHKARKDLCIMAAKSKDGPKKSLAEQADDAETKCTKGDAESCALIGGAYLTGKGGKTKDEPKGVEFLTKACDLKSGMGCEFLGRAYEEARGVTMDKEKAKALFKQSCDIGEGGGCRAYALKFEFSDPARIPFLEKACTKDDKLGCMGLGAAYLHGNQGAKKDLPKAKQFLQKACDLGATSACDKAREL